jgi:hypothetical protein
MVPLNIQFYDFAPFLSAKYVKAATDFFSNHPFKDAIPIFRRPYKVVLTMPQRMG